MKIVAGLLASVLLVACGQGAPPSAATPDLAPTQIAEPITVAEPSEDGDAEFEGAFAPTPEAQRFVEASVALWDELMRCSASPAFAEVGLSPRTTPCRRWASDLEAIQNDDQGAREAMRTGFNCLPGETHSVALSLIPPVSAEDRQLVEFFRSEFEACRGRLQRWQASQN